jgi:ABC-type Na+ transport system ATPase subunit NatA
VDVQKDPNTVRSLIGLAGQYAAVDETLTGRENLVMVGRLYRLGAKLAKVRAAESLERLGLVEAADRPVKTYSGGMRRRLDLGASLVGRPRVLILDEPTTGLDPRTRLDMWSFNFRVSFGRSSVGHVQDQEEPDGEAPGADRWGGCVHEWLGCRHDLDISVVSPLPG